MENHDTEALARSPLFQIPSERLTFNARIQLSLDRAKAVVNAYGLTKDDVLNVSSRYWKFHTDPILLMDGAMGTLLTIHYNLCAGTLAVYASERSDICLILDKLLRFEILGQYCLTEVGHGLDAIRLETTATLLGNGEFDLNTPIDRAAKYMPPTTPCGIPCISIVFARLMVNGEDRGVKHFIVPLHDGKRMYSGIESKLLSPRGGARPVAHAITYFHNVRLPANSLLSSVDLPKDSRIAFSQHISRVVIGTLSMGAFALSSMRIASFIAGKYSQRRVVGDASTGRTRPIISFSTQYIPVLVSISQTLVMAAYAGESHRRFTDPNASSISRHLTAAVFKTTIMAHTHAVLPKLGDRCGAQGLFEVNQISVMHEDMRGAAIAEGDTLGISIRFAIDILLGRISPSPPEDTNSLLFRHEQSMISTLRELMARSTTHRDAQLESTLLPHCQSLIESIGHRSAWEAAVRHQLDQEIIDLYVASVVCLDPAWYIESGCLGSHAQMGMLLRAARALYPRLEELISRLHVENYVTAPITSDDSWNRYVSSLKTFGQTLTTDGDITEDTIAQRMMVVDFEAKL